MTAIIITAMICATLIALFVLYLRAVKGNVTDDITLIHAGLEAHSARLEQLERDTKKHGAEFTKINLGKIR